MGGIDKIYVKVQTQQAPTIDTPTRDVILSRDVVADQLNNVSASGGLGTVPDAEFAYLNITPKSLMSFVQKVFAYIYSRKDSDSFYTKRLGQTLVGGLVALDRDITQYNSFTVNAPINLGVASNPVPVIGGTCEGILVADGVNMPSLTGITKWPTSYFYDNTASKQNQYSIFRLGSGTWIIWTQLN